MKTWMICAATGIGIMCGAATVTAAPNLAADSTASAWAKDGGIEMGKDGGIAMGKDSGVAMGKDAGIAMGKDAGMMFGKDGGAALMAKDGGGWIAMGKDGGVQAAPLSE